MLNFDGAGFANRKAAGPPFKVTPRLKMPSFADALNRVGFFLTDRQATRLLAQLLHGGFEALDGEGVHMIIDQLSGHDQ